MKILHTSDWHLGHTLYNHERVAEQTSMLNQIADIVSHEQPDLFLLCGDVYHTAQPSAATQTLYTEALFKIHNACPTMTIITTAGNHDSGVKHDIFRKPWQQLNVYTIGNLNRNDLSQHIIEIPNKAYVIAIPYVNERNIPDGLFTTLLDQVNERNNLSLPVVMTAHTTIRGCDFTGHDNADEYSVGGIDSMDISQFGNGYDYLALGHIHHPQFVHTGKHNVRYCGTPLAVSFDEDYEHSVSIVEIQNHGDQPTLRTITINNPYPLITLPRQGFTSWDEAKQILKEFPNDLPAYIRLNVEVTEPLDSNARNEIEQIIAPKQCRFGTINTKRSPRISQEQVRSLSIEEFQAQKPINIAMQFAQDSGIQLSEEMIELFNQACRAVEDDERNY